MSATYPLEPDEQQMRALAGRAVDFVVTFISSLEDAPAGDVEGADELARRLVEAVPRTGVPIEELLETIGEAAAKAFNAAGPGYLAFIPGGGIFAAALADFIADGINRFTNLWAPAPALVQLEVNVVRWLSDLFDYPEQARGVLTTGGSTASLSAIVTARTALLEEDFLKGTLYTSEQVHTSVVKAAMLAGFPRANVRLVETTPGLRLDVGALARAVKEDRQAGMQPFCVVPSAGTTNTGAVDPLAEVADLCEAEGLWMHVDAAYGGPFQMTERGRKLFAGIDRADSITLDPHKAMFLPYGTGCLLVRDGEQLRAAHQGEGAYLQDLAHGGEGINFADYSADLSRDYRGLRVWLPLKLHGLDAFRDALDEKLDLTRYLHEELAATPGFEVPWEPDLTVVPFRYVPEGGDVNELNKELLRAINASQRVFLSSTLIDGKFILRACIVSFRTHRDRIEEAVSIIRRAALDLA